MSDNQYISNKTFYAVRDFLTANIDGYKKNSFICKLSSENNYDPDPRNLSDVKCNPNEIKEELKIRIEKYRSDVIKNKEYFENSKLRMTKNKKK